MKILNLIRKSKIQFFKLTENEMSDKACFSSENCRVKAYYVKDSGIFYIDKMQPEKDICDKSIILHEMIHHYQKNDDRVIELDERTLGHFKKDKHLLSKSFF